jgi:hypothetical protein
MSMRMEWLRAEHPVAPAIFSSSVQVWLPSSDTELLAPGKYSDQTRVTTASGLRSVMSRGELKATVSY